MIVKAVFTSWFAAKSKRRGGKARVLDSVVVLLAELEVRVAGLASLPSYQHSLALVCW